MRIAERSRCQQRLIRLEPAQRAVEPRRLQAFLRRQRRQDGRQPLAEHGLAGTGAADHANDIADLSPGVFKKIGPQWGKSRLYNVPGINHI